MKDFFHFFRKHINQLKNQELVEQQLQNKKDKEEIIANFSQQIQTFIMSGKFASLCFFLDEIRNHPYLKELTQIQYDLSPYQKDHDFKLELKESFFKLLDLGFFDNRFTYYSAKEIKYTTLNMVILPYERTLMYLGCEDMKNIHGKLEIFYNSLKRDTKINQNKELYLAECKKASESIYVDNFMSKVETICLNTFVQKEILKPIKKKLL